MASSAYSSTEEEQNLGSYDDISRSLTYTKQTVEDCSRRSSGGDTVSNSKTSEYSTNFDSPASSSRSNAISELVSGDNYSERFTDYTTDSLCEEGDNYSSTFTTQTHSSTADQTSTFTNSYTADFSIGSRVTSTYITDSLSTEELNKELQSSRSGYSDDSFVSESKSESPHSISKSVTISQDDVTTSSNGYSSDFEQSLKSETIDHPETDPVEFYRQQIERQLLYLKSMNSPHQESLTSCVQPGIADSWATNLKKSSAVLSESGRQYITSSINNLKNLKPDSSGQLGDGGRVRAADSDKQPMNRDVIIPRDHCFMSRVERLRIDNILTGMKQMSDKLDQEIINHKEVTRAGLPHQAISNFVLPRKLRLNQTAFSLRLDQYQASMNSIAMIGSLARDLPKPTERAEDIWHQLMNTAQRRINSPSPTEQAIDCDTKLNA